MPYLYENSKQNFSNMDHFKEVAVKTINELFGRKNPLDIYDFSEHKDTYKCIARYEHEDVPPEEVEGAPLSAEAMAELNKFKGEELTEDEIAEQEFQARKQDVAARYGMGVELSDEDFEFGVEHGVIQVVEDEGKIVEDETTKIDLDIVLKASDEAISLAAEHNIDLKLVTGTGANGNIKKGDVAAYIEANGSNPAPLTENADDNGNEQPDA